MHYDNVFELLISVVFSVRPKLRGLGTKAQELVIHLSLVEGETIPYFHLIDLEIRSELVLMRYKTGKINKLTGKCIMELSKLKHLQRYMNYFDLYFRRFECQPQSKQLSIIFTPPMEVIFETI